MSLHLHSDWVHSKILQASDAFEKETKASELESKRESLFAQAEACSASLPDLQTAFKTACAAEQAKVDPEACKEAKGTIKGKFKECKALLRDANKMKKDAESGASGGVASLHKGRLGGIGDMEWGAPQEDHASCVERQVRMGGEARNDEEKDAMSVQCALEQGQHWSDPIQMNIANHCPTQRILIGKGSTHLSVTPELLPKSELELGPGEGGRYEGHERELWVVVDRSTGKDLDQWTLENESNACGAVPYIGVAGSRGSTPCGEWNLGRFLWFAAS